MNAPQDDNYKQFLLDQAKRAIAVRSKDREFHGLEHEFMNFQFQMQADYEISKDLKHPRDLGDSREEILRKFLTANGIIPRRYAVSSNSSRVVSPSGHMSKEIDILLYDPLDSIGLMSRESVYYAYPIESVYGVIQVKSRLNRGEIKSGLDNIRSFKSLSRPAMPHKDFVLRQGAREQRGFGLLFAYDSDLEWKEMVEEIGGYSKAQPNHNWCNGVFILNRGFILHGEGHSGAIYNRELDSIKKLQMHGNPDRQGLCLSHFYGTLLKLLRATDIQPTVVEAYGRLPLVAGPLSYEFAFGAFAEFHSCEKHGDYQRKIAPKTLKKLIEWCTTAEPINWIRATEIAYGGLGDNEAAYARQPLDVRIYNPEDLPLSQILVGTDLKQGLSYDYIRAGGMDLYIPYYYSAKEGLISDCPKCSK